MELGRYVAPPVIDPERQVARPERFELPTFWFVARRSIQLSYERVLRGSNYDLIVSARFGSVKPTHGRPWLVKNIKAVIRENPLAGIGVALLEVAGGQGKNMLRGSRLVKTQQAVLPAPGTAAAHAAP